MLKLSSKVHANQSILNDTRTTEADKSSVRQAFEAYSKGKALNRKRPMTTTEVTILG